MSLRTNGRFLILALIFGVVYSSCKDEKTFTPATIPTNPFDTVNYNNPGVTIPVDSQTFLGLHLYIFSTTCAVPGCHDGSFEPDFRTVQSAYNTLVYHKVEKNNATNDFKYRVIPGNSAESWLHERITTNDAVLGRMPLYDTLTPREIELIRNWIDDGAPDLFGHSPIIPTMLPTFFGVIAYENDTTGMRVDTPRASIVEPMVFPKNKSVEVWIGLVDQNPEGTYIPASDFTYNKYKISNHMFEFSGKPEMPLLVEPPLKPHMAPNSFDPPGSPLLPYYHHFIINTANYSPGHVYYFRVYVQDKDHNSPTEIPSDGSQFYLMTFFSFVVQ